jgi:hypothetical protein
MNILPQLDDFVSGETLRNTCSQVFKPTAFDSTITSPLQSGPLFVKTDYVPELFQRLKTETKLRFNLITHNSDIPITDEMLDLCPPCINKWFAINACTYNPKVVPIPIGLANSYCKITAKAEQIRNLPLQVGQPAYLYVNFRSATYKPGARISLDYLKSKKADWITFGDMDGVKTDQNVIQKYLTELVSHKFAVCPRGNGVDTHRLWEALYAGTIPIVRMEPAYRNFTDLPILFVNQWSELTKEFLDEKYEEITKRIWCLDKLRASWWGRQFSQLGEFQ